MMMTQDIQELCNALDNETKRHRGQPLSIDTKQNIVRDLLQQRQERAAANKTKNDHCKRTKRTTTNQTTIARRYSVAQSTVSK